MTAPKFKQYKSRANGTIHAANVSSPGYEDAHPQDWMPVGDAVGVDVVEVDVVEVDPVPTAPSALFAGIAPAPWSDGE